MVIARKKFYKLNSATGDLQYAARNKSPWDQAVERFHASLLGRGGNNASLLDYRRQEKRNGERPHCVNGQVENWPPRRAPNGYYGRLRVPIFPVAIAESRRRPKGSEKVTSRMGQ